MIHVVCICGHYEDDHARVHRVGHCEPPDVFCKCDVFTEIVEITSKNGANTRAKTFGWGTSGMGVYHALGRGFDQIRNEGSHGRAALLDGNEVFWVVPQACAHCGDEVDGEVSAVAIAPDGYASDVTERVNVLLCDECREVILWENRNRRVSLELELELEEAGTSER